MAQMTPEQYEGFTMIVDTYLRSSDLSTVTARKVRSHLEASIGYDLSYLKAPVKELIQQRFDNILAEQDPSNIEHDVDVSNLSNGADFSASHSTLAEVPTKRKYAEVVDDAKLAEKLHRELNSVRSASAQRKNGPTKSRSVKKSKAVVDSDGSGAEEPEKKKRPINRNNPFNAPMQLSEALSNLIGKTECSRPECVKHIWAYVKQNGLQDPDDKRYIICDDTMKAVFNNASRVHMFTMNKVLSGHLYPIAAQKSEEA